MSEKKQVKFWAEADVYDWLQSQPNMTHTLNELVRTRIKKDPEFESRLLELKNIQGELISLLKALTKAYIAGKTDAATLEDIRKRLKMLDIAETLGPLF
jgi:ADP-dependent phosphofructokinase/glucokinase